MSHKLIINSQKYTAKPGESILDVLQREDITINAPCGGNGTCGKCKVKVIAGGGVVTETEKKLLNKSTIQAGFRLACRTRVEPDMVVEVEKDEEITALTGGILSELTINPDLRQEKIEIEKPSLTDQRDYLERLQDRLSVKNINYHALQQLSVLVENGESYQIVSTPKKVISILPVTEQVAMYGIAVDIGTTTIAMYLIDLETGTEVDVISFYNPQKKYGADVISRINFSSQNQSHLQKLQDSLVKSLNEGINRLCKQNDLQDKDIYKLVVAGNTVMLHTLTGLNTATIARTPYIPVFTENIILNADDLKLNINPNGVIELLPGISGYVGADIVAGLLVADFSTTDWNLFIDIGTNGEIVLGNNKKYYACSAAAGPAFEGAGLTYGMAGVPGAVSDFRIAENKLIYNTIAGEKARGICGSGLVDILAELLKNNFINVSGAFNEKEEWAEWQQNLLTEYDNKPAFRVVEASKTMTGESIVLTQQDIRKYQLAAGAIIAGIKILMKEAGINLSDIHKVYLAGGFGNYINPESACTTGLIPGELLSKIVRIGNAAGTGARMYLVNRNMQEKTLKIKNKTEYIELSTCADFQTEFMEAMMLGS